MDARTNLSLIYQHSIPKHHQKRRNKRVRKVYRRVKTQNRKVDVAVLKRRRNKRNSLKTSFFSGMKKWTIKLMKFLGKIILIRYQFGLTRSNRNISHKSNKLNNMVRPTWLSLWSWLKFKWQENHKIWIKQMKLNAIAEPLESTWPHSNTRYWRYLSNRFLKKRRIPFTLYAKFSDKVLKTHIKSTSKQMLKEMIDKVWLRTTREYLNSFSRSIL